MLDQDLDMAITSVAVGSKTIHGYRPLTLATNRGDINTQHYHSPGASRAIIYIGDGTFDSPGIQLFPRLCEDLLLYRFSALRIAYRSSGDLAECVLDVLSGITFLESMGITSFGIVGYSFGGAVAIQAATLTYSVKTVVTLGTQWFGTDVAADLKETSLFAIHGLKDKISPKYASTYVHDIAQSDKKLLFYENAGHNLHEVEQEVYFDIHDWVSEQIPTLTYRNQYQ